MNTFNASLIAISAVPGAITLKPKTDEIISKHTEAMGNKDKLAQISSVYIERSTLRSQIRSCNFSRCNGQYKKVEVNKEIDPKIFDMPKK